MPATANTRHLTPQAQFTLRVKKRLLDLNLSVTDLATKLGLNRNTVSLAINRGLYEPTRKAVADYLQIPL